MAYAESRDQSPSAAAKENFRRSWEQCVVDGSTPWSLINTPRNAWPKRNRAEPPEQLAERTDITCSIPLRALCVSVVNPSLRDLWHPPADPLGDPGNALNGRVFFGANA